MEIIGHNLMSKLNEIIAEASRLINFIAEIEWSFTYGVFQGTITDSESAVPILGEEECGKFQVRSSELSGSQETTISWYRDEGNIKLRVLGVTEPK